MPLSLHYSRITLLYLHWLWKLSTLKSLGAEIKRLEAQKKVVEKRDSEVLKALAVFQLYA